VFSVAYPAAMLVHLLVLIDKSRQAMWLSLWIVAMTVALLSSCVMIFDNRRASKQKAADLHELRRQLGLVKEGESLIGGCEPTVLDSRLL